MCVFHLASDVVVTKKNKERRNESNRSQSTISVQEQRFVRFDRASNFGTTAALPQLEKNHKEEEPFCFLRTNEKKVSVSQIHGRQFPVVTAVVCTDCTEGDA